MRVTEDHRDGSWVVIGRELGMRELAFQRAETYTPPRWPDPGHPQQEHLDIRVDDVESAQRAVLGLGATLLEGEKGTGFRVFADPAGHPFCLVY